MEAADLVDQLDFLGLSLADLAVLIERPEDWCARLVKGDEPIPHWLSLMIATWAEVPRALKLAREMADVGRVGSH